MDGPILDLTLGVLAFAVALNLKLTLAVLHASRRERHPPAAPVPGQPVRPVSARALAGRARLQVAGAGHAWALVFLSSRCPTCRARLPELERIAPLAQAAGLAIRIVSEEAPWRLRAFLRGSALLTIVARVNRQDYRELNPNLASPSYQFVDHQGRLEAVGLIGDDDWRALCAQLAGGAGIGEAA